MYSGDKKVGLSWDYEFLLERTYLQHYLGTSGPYPLNARKNNNKGNRAATFKLTGEVKKCSKGGLCIAECRNNAGLPGTGTTRVKCTKYQGWQMAAQRCKVTKRSWKGYN